MSSRNQPGSITLTLPEAVKRVGSLLQDHQAEEAARLCRAILAAAPQHVHTLCLYGFASAALGAFEDAARSYRAALELRPDMAEVHNNLGLALAALGRYEEASESYVTAVRLKPEYAVAWNNLGIAQKELKRHEDAIASYEQAIRLNPGLPDSRTNLGNVLRVLDRHEEALVSYQRALELRPADADAHSNLGLALHALRRFDESLDCYRKALDLRPGSAEIHYNLGVTLAALGRDEKAAASYQRALGLRPNYAEAHNNLGNALRRLRRPHEAIASLNAALAIRPEHAAAHNNLGVALAMLERHEEAVLSYRRALELNGGYADAWFNLGNALRALGRHVEAIASYNKTFELRPDDGNALMLMAAGCRQICDWRDFDEQKRALEEWTLSAKLPFTPFGFLAFSDDPAKQLACARRHAQHAIPAVMPLPAALLEDLPPPIRIAYLSGDFREHATAFLMAELFEAHDRDRFEIHAISFGPERQDAMRERLVAAFDHFHDVREQSDRDVALLIRDLGIQVAVDLKGYTQGCRPAILSYRPAPIQVNYLGYPGTMGVEFIDYMLVDRFVVPPEEQRFFTERLVYLPDCYQVNDGKRPLPRAVPSRAAVGLPEDGFVFCCFNNNYKITPEVFAVWMRLLASNPQSVLWLLKDNEDAEPNLRREAEARGVSAERLIFAPRTTLPDHLARHGCADLFLDTFPYGAHTTASDALWSGLPLLTCIGRSFASRVAGSLLRCVGLSELVVDSLDAYESLAKQLAGDPGRLAELRRILAGNRAVSPLFDGRRFARSIEAAYIEMLTWWKNAQ